MKGSAVAVLAALMLAGCAADAPPAAEPVADFTELDLAPTATTGIIRGIVVDDAIRPIGGVTVTLQTESGPRESKSTEDGVFGYDGLPGGTYFLTAAKPGYVGAQASTDVVPGAAEPPITKILLVLDPATTPYVTSIVWNGFIECSLRAGVPPGTTGTGVNACNDVANQDVNFPVTIEGVPDLIQGELVWTDTQSLGSGLSFVVGPHSCVDVKWNRADGPSTLILPLAKADLEDEDDFIDDSGLCYRVFSWTADESSNLAGLVLSQRFDAYFHIFYNFLPPEGWKFSVDGEPVPPS
jgi:hypothetical protein